MTPADPSKGSGPCHTLQHADRRLRRLQIIGLAEAESVLRMRTYALAGLSAFPGKVPCAGDLCGLQDELNLECAELAGIRAIHFRDADRLRGSLAGLGVGVSAKETAWNWG